MPRDLACCLVLNAFPPDWEGFHVESTKMTWSQEETQEFIEEYRKLAVLWDIRLQQYKNNQAKLDALRGLAEKFNCDMAMVKNKIKNLRTAFHHEHRRLTQTKSGSSPIKRSKWFAYDLLLFLLDVDSPRPGCSSQAEQPICAGVRPREKSSIESRQTWTKVTEVMILNKNRQEAKTRTVKVTFKTREMAQRAMRDGLAICNQFVPPHQVEEDITLQDMTGQHTYQQALNEYYKANNLPTANMPKMASGQQITEKLLTLSSPQTQVQTTLNKLTTPQQQMHTQQPSCAHTQPSAIDDTQTTPTQMEDTTIVVKRAAEKATESEEECEMEKAKKKNIKKNT
ncbi:uncharacterized protein [Macrobrachium rosenbergii]|uniref:uncharacterized protein n=1 Tax=Macrobrachium rosenbergii TaxID=79674 RepID=UPI0034D5C092